MEYFIVGFLIKFVTTLDDSISRTVILNRVCTTRAHTVAFVGGNLLAVALTIICALLAADVMRQLPYLNIIAGCLVLTVAVLTLFNAIDRLAHALSRHVERFFSTSRIAGDYYTITLLLIGFFTSLALVADDTLALLPLFLEGPTATTLAVTGILSAALLQNVLVVYAAKYFEYIPFRKWLSVLLLVAVAIAIFTGIL